MGFWSNLQAAGTTAMAASFIDKRMTAALAAGQPAIPGDTRKFAEGLVKTLWSSMPALAQQHAKPKAVLVAAAALAHGIKQCDSRGRRDLSERMFPCLRAILEFDVRKLVATDALSPIDDVLFNFAHSVFELPEPIPKGIFDEGQQVDESKPSVSPATTPWKSQFSDPSFRVTPSMPDIRQSAPASIFHASSLYVASYISPETVAKTTHGVDLPISYLFAASVYDTNIQKLKSVFTLERSFTGAIFFCLFDRTGERENMGEWCVVAELPVFEAEVLRRVCEAASIAAASVQQIKG